MARGFTLLEILIAMAIFTLIGLGSTAVLTTVIDSNQLSAERVEKLQHLQRAMMIMERDFQQAVPRKIRYEGQSIDAVLRSGANEFDSEMDGVGLVRSGWQNPQLMLPRSTLQALVYRVQDGQLQRLHTVHVDNSTGVEPKVRVLLDNIDDFQVEVLLAGQGDYDDSQWEEDTITPQLPRAIAITLESKDFGRIRREWLLAGAQ
ncbi:type II secretion system minor pseudopilin GspJ [Aestuariibacter halophilus]|uniref:Type II secretion system protein J n=1 Tax=Fluctibacter halophilus TaxID=226011 RepID=A0ABS8G8Z2_9ALTE|nr:type II secretion system minor pseudopilin GspJ [Aestuariibacter halophilus]MCC2617047.1 type II secretion system minor pseudopilin GspJ [Aestuariibacter halophilus]